MSAPLGNAEEMIAAAPVGSMVYSRFKTGACGAWQAHWSRQGVHVWATQRENQKVQNPPEFDRLLNILGERIAGAFDT